MICIKNWLRHRTEIVRTAAELRNLNDAMLADVGLTRSVLKQLSPLAPAIELEERERTAGRAPQFNFQRLLQEVYYERQARELRGA
ncbi:MAG: DUF1127 domain-containing protein [Candidatus Competibacterales bacterium]